MSTALALVEDARREFKRTRRDAPQFLVVDPRTYRKLQGEYPEAFDDSPQTVFGLWIVVLPTARTFRLQVLGNPDKEAQ